MLPPGRPHLSWFFRLLRFSSSTSPPDLQQKGIEMITQLPNPLLHSPQQCIRACCSVRLRLEVCQAAGACCAALCAFNMRFQQLPVVLVQRASKRPQMLQSALGTHRNMIPAPTFSTPSMPLGPGASTYLAAGAPA